MPHTTQQIELMTDLLCLQGEIADFDSSNHQAQIAIENVHELGKIVQEIPTGEMEVNTAILTQSNLIAAAESFLKFKECHIKPRLGVSTIESYGGRSTAQMVLVSTIESIGDHLKTIVTRVIEWIKKAYEWIRAVLQRTRKNATGIATRAKRILGEAQGVASKKLKEDAGEVENKTLANFFVDDTGRAISAMSIPTLYKKFVDDLVKQFTNEFVSSTATDLREIVDAIDRSDAQDGIEEKTAKLISKVLTESLQSHFKQATHQNDASSGAHPATSVYEYRLPFSGRIIYLSEYKGNVGGKSIRFTMKDSHVDHGHSSLPVLKPEEIIELAKIVDETMTYGPAQNFKRIETEVQNTERIINRAIDAVVKRMQNAIKRGERQDAYSLEFLRSIFHAIGMLIGVVQKYDQQTTTYILDWCEASLSKYA